MAFCTNCGAQNQDGAQFCTGCGSPIRAALATPPGQLSPVSDAPLPALSYSASGTTQGATPGPPLPPGAPYAQWADRVVGYLIDLVLVGVGMGILYWLVVGLFAMMAGLGSSVGGGMCCVMILLFPISTLLVGLFNSVYLVSQRGASIGQGVMNLKVVDINGNLLSMGTAFIRLIARVALGFVPMVGPLLDLLWPLWDEKRQTLHDKAVGSFVLKLQ
jgi:uncharacterized RDD family membrane protein YckC